ncbi:hypothetical protein KM043_014731 [Ampulex compressa]|nr:hypothetical protein KM043_014731 [Ampulex compressa]
MNTPSSSEKETQIERDRSLRDKRRRIKDDVDPEDRFRRINLAKDFIDDLKHNGPANLLHVAALSSILQKPIRVWQSSGNLHRVIGDFAQDHILDVEYHEPKSSSIGHWTLPGDKDPSSIETEPNGCLFSVIASQIDADPRKLRKETIRRLRRNLRVIYDNADDISWLEKNDRIGLMIGGARYSGSSSGAAAVILDKSQNAPCENCTALGHPRGHASHPGATGTADSVENYSRTGFKTGFLSRADQNYAANLALRHTYAENAMRRLNEGSWTETVTIETRDVASNGTSFPKGKEYVGGEARSKERDVYAMKLVLRHHKGKSNDPDADVFVHTFYPML